MPNAAFALAFKVKQTLIGGVFAAEYLLDVMRAILRRWRVTLSFLLIQTVAVCVVYAFYANSVVHHYEDPEMQWLWLSMLDFPSSGLVAIFQPQYGLQCAIAFFAVGGIQWGMIGAVLDALFSRQHENNI
jgi:hypothetical protein